MGPLRARGRSGDGGAAHAVALDKAERGHLLDLLTRRAGGEDEVVGFERLQRREARCVSIWRARTRRASLGTAHGLEEVGAASWAFGP